MACVGLSFSLQKPTWSSAVSMLNAARRGPTLFQIFMDMLMAKTLSSPGTVLKKLIVWSSRVLRLLNTYAHPNCYKMPLFSQPYTEPVGSSTQADTLFIWDLVWCYHSVYVQIFHFVATLLFLRTKYSWTARKLWNWHIFSSKFYLYVVFFLRCYGYCLTLQSKFDIL
jgi:hypothetical protein